MPTRTAIAFLVGALVTVVPFTSALTTSGTTTTTVPCARTTVGGVWTTSTVTQTVTDQVFETFNYGILATTTVTVTAPQPTCTNYITLSGTVTRTSTSTVHTTQTTTLTNTQVFTVPTTVTINPWSP